MKNTFLLTDVLPEEIPIIYSNYKLFDYLEKSQVWDSIKEIRDMKFPGTEPFQFFITKANSKKRLLSLIHPISQMIFTKFIALYDEELLHHFGIYSIFSCRFPVAVSRQKTFDPENGGDSQEEWILENIKNYFKYGYVRITDFYKSPRLFDLELKFSHLYMIDIQHCFYNLYTHSIEWAWLGSKEIAKQNIRKNSNYNLGRILDRIMQCSNDMETNGIVVGPEFSRIVSEIVLSRIDYEVFQVLSEKRKIFKKDYEVVRFIDDIFIFTNDEQLAIFIEELYVTSLMKFKLNINESKSTMEKRPFLTNHLWVQDLKNIIEKVEQWIQRDKKKSASYSKKGALDFKYSIIQELKSVVTEYSDQKQHIISYFIIALDQGLKRLTKINLVQDTKKNKNESSDKSNNIDETILTKLSYYIDIIQFAVILNPNSSNILKFCRTCFSIRIITKELDEVLYKKCLEILKFNLSVNSEIINIISFLKELKKDVPKEILMKVLGEEPDYFSLSVISFYLCSEDRKFKYPEIRNKINKTIKTKIDKINFYFKKTNKNTYKNEDLKRLLCKNELMELHDFYCCPILFDEVRKDISRIFAAISISIKNLDPTRDPFLYLYADYIKNHDKPLMQWDFDGKLIYRRVELKLKSRFSQAYT